MLHSWRSMHSGSHGAILDTDVNGPFLHATVFFDSSGAIYARGRNPLDYCPAVIRNYECSFLS